MGIYSKNGTSLGDYNVENVVAREGYESSFGAALIMMESAVNEEKMFEYIIRQDLTEAASRIAGVAIDESVEIIQEGVQELGASIKKMIMSAWEKIKGLFKSFLAKFDSVIMRDTKALFNKHKTEFVKNTGKLKKWKWSKLKTELTCAHGVDKANSEFNGLCDLAKADPEKLQEEISDGTALENVLSGAAGNTDRKSFAKDYHNYFFDDDETFTDETVGSDIRGIISSVMTDNKLVSNAKKSADAVDKAFSTMLKSVDTAIKSLSTKVVAKDYNGSGTEVKYKDNTKYMGNLDKDSNQPKDGSVSMKKLNALRAAVTTTQTGYNMITGAYLNEVKFQIKQCRRVFGQIISMRAAKNEAVLLDAIGESAEYEIDSTFDSYELA